VGKTKGKAPKVVFLEPWWQISNGGDGFGKNRAAQVNEAISEKGTIEKILFKRKRAGWIQSNRFGQGNSPIGGCKKKQGKKGKLLGFAVKNYGSRAYKEKGGGHPTKRR